MVFVYFYIGSTGSGSGFKSSQKMGPRLKECIKPCYCFFKLPQYII